MEQGFMVLAMLAGGLLVSAGAYFGLYFGYKMGKAGQHLPSLEHGLTAVFDDMPGPLRPTKVGEDM